MLKAYTAADIRALEEPFVSAPDYDDELMRKAAYGLYQQTLKLLENKPDAGLLLLIGSGNNGGDGLYAGAHLAHAGYRVDAIFTGKTAHKKGKEAFLAAGGRVLESSQKLDIASYTIFIDAILGTGARGGLCGAAAELVQKITQHKDKDAQVIACDLPSGIDGSTGEMHEPILDADLTVTFIARKVPHLSSAAYRCGTVEVIKLGIEDNLKDFTPAICQYEMPEIGQLIRVPGPYDHKYARGVCGLLTGSEEYPGAALLSTQACINTGVGMVRFGAVAHLASLIHLRNPEAVCFTGDPAEQKVQAWLAGSGATGQERENHIFAALAAKEPAVLDAAAINKTAQWISDKGVLSTTHILTPHAGELEEFFMWMHALKTSAWQEAAGDIQPPSRLEIEARPADWVKIAHKLSGATVLLKGAITHIAGDDKTVWSVRTDAHYLASAGSGDVLAGIIGGLLAQNQAAKEPLPAKDIAQLACFIHGVSADLINTGTGPTPASALAEHIPAAIAYLMNNR